MSLMELPGAEGGLTGEALYPLGLPVCSSVFIQLGCISILGTGFGGFWSVCSGRWKG